MTTLTELEGRETALLGHAKAHGFPMLRSTRDEKNANGLPEVSDDSEDSDKFETINLTGSRKPLSVDRLSDSTYFELGHSTISDHEISGHEADNLNPTWMSTGVSAKDGGCIEPTSTSELYFLSGENHSLVHTLLHCVCSNNGTDDKDPTHFLSDMGIAATSDLLNGDVWLLGSTINEFGSNIDSFSNIGTKSWSSKIVQLPHRYGPHDKYTSGAHRYHSHIDGNTLWSLGTSDARLVSSFMMESHDITTCFSGKQLCRASNPPALLGMTARGDAHTSSHAKAVKANNFRLCRIAACVIQRGFRSYIVLRNAMIKGMACHKDVCYPCAICMPAISC